MVTLTHIQPSRKTRYGLPNLVVAGVLLLTAIVGFWTAWATYATNVPKWDDHVLRYFLFKLDQETSFSGKIHQFVRQHNEHRIIYDRLIAWLDYHLTGKMNFVHLMFVGNLSLLGLLTVFGLVLSHTDDGQRSAFNRQSVLNWRAGLVYLPPVAFLLLNLSQWENMFWGMAALQNFTVMLWVFGTLYVLAYTQKIGLALGLAFAATLTSGNGLLVWPVGFGMLLIQGLTGAKFQPRTGLLWSTGAVLSFVLYFWGYVKPPGNPPINSSLVELLQGWLAFNGSAGEAVPVEPVVTMCVVLGGICLVLTLLSCLNILRKRLGREALAPLDYFFLGAAAFLIGTSVIVAWTRTGFGINTLITSRYKLYSLLLMALLYTYIVSESGVWLKKWVLWSALLFSVGITVGSYVTYLNEAIWWRHWMLTNQFNWTHSSNSPAVSRDSVSEKYASLAPAFYDALLPTIYGPAQQPVAKIEVEDTPDGYVIVSSDAPALRGANSGNFVLARSPKRTYLFPVRQNRQSFRNAITGSGNLFTTGFRAPVPVAELEAGEYQLFVLSVSKETASLHPTNKIIGSSGVTGNTTETNW